MPLYTQNYNLAAFQWGDIYSASIDQYRFVTIDNHLAFISDEIGEGIITGWEIENQGSGIIQVSAGMGVIGRRVYESFGNLAGTLQSNTVQYFFMKARNEVGGISTHSDIAEVTAFDDIPPSSPSGLLKVDSLVIYLSSLSSYDDDFILYLKQLLDKKEEDDNIELIGYSQIAFQWNVSTEPDFSHYIIRRINNDSGDPYIVLGTTSETIYIDINLEQNTAYTYQIIAVDLSGNESSASEIQITTDVDTRVPLPPSFLQSFPSNESMQAIWNHSPSDNVNIYRVTLQPLDNDYKEYGSSTISDVDAASDAYFNSAYVIFQNLENNRYYKVSVIAISDAGYSSESISIISYIRYLPGSGEINEIDISFSVDSNGNGDLQADISWKYDLLDTYLDYADKFYITFIENGHRYSDPIKVLAEDVLVTCSDDYEGHCYEKPIKLLPFNEGGIIRYESIKEYTPYLVLIQTVDEEGNISNGVIERIAKTPVVGEVGPVTDVSFDRQSDNSILLTWKNPIESYFAYNLITITIEDLTNPLDPSDNPSGFEEEVYVLDKRIDLSENFVIPSSKFNVNYRYTTQIVSYDVFGSEGHTYTSMNVFEQETDALRPSNPSSLSINSGDGEIYLKWIMPSDEIPNIAYYKIYRAAFSYYLRPSDFSSIAIIPSIAMNFTDYTVTNGTTYTYFVTAIDIFGNESLNNSTSDLYFPSFLLSSTPYSRNALSVPTGLSVTANSNESDAELTWDSSSGAFDGYEILRSDGDNYSFTVIGYAYPSDTSYIDADALLKDGVTYHYMIRKYLSDVLLYRSSSGTDIDGYVFIGKVTTTDGTNTVTVDTSSVRHLLNFEAPIREKVQEIILTHNHKNEYGIDKRIDLSSNSVVQDWTTVDYQVYETESDIEGATTYIVKISGTLNADYFKDSSGNVDSARYSMAQSGESPVLYEVLPDEKKIVFNEILYSSCVPSNEFMTVSVECPVTPYSSAPVITLELLNVSEVDNYLTNDKIGNLSASQVSSGMISSYQMSDVQHEGRVGEEMVPLKLPMQSIDNFSYSLAAVYEEDRNKIGSSATFYDFVKADGEQQILAATSSGVWISNDFGNSWTLGTNFPTAVFRLYKSQTGKYYSLTNYGVYLNNGSSFHSWEKMGGLDYIKVVRDITEDEDGNLYISTDLGVFKLNSQFVPYIEDNWEKMHIFGARSSEAYAIMYDSYYGGTSEDGRLVVSNELGLLQSTDNGESWQYIYELEPGIKVRQFYQYGNYIFILTDNSIYRKLNSESQFVLISDLDSDICRNMEIFNDRIYITTNDGPYGSVSSDIYTDTDISFVSVWPDTHIHNHNVVIHAIKEIDDILFIGTDRRLFLMDTSKIWMQYEQKNAVIPTVYVNSVIQTLGFYYNNNGEYHNVCFNESLGTEDIVEVSNLYDIYYAQYGGWSHLKYDAKFVVYQNGSEFGESKDLMELDRTPFSTLVLPSYTDDNAHKEKADEYKSVLETDLATLNNSTETSGDSISILVSSVYNDFELFLSQLYEDARVVTNSSGETVPFVLPAINAELVKKNTVINNTGETTTEEVSAYYEINTLKNKSYTATANVVSGMFVFDLPFDRYDNLTLDIYDVTVKNAGGNTHREVEDKFEYVYSGFPEQLSQVQQINLVKLGIFTQKTWPGQQDSLSPALQAEFIVPTDTSILDTLNSTINYDEKIVVEDTSADLFYVSSVFYVSTTGRILAGGIGSLLSIDIFTLNITKVEISLYENEMAKGFIDSSSKIYLVTDQRVFMSEDYGLTWSEYCRSGLPNQLYSIGVVANNLVVGASDGIYTQPSSITTASWDQAKTSSHPVTVILSSNIIFTVINGTIHTSANGYNFSDSTLGEDMDINSMHRYNYTNLYISSNQGLYSDNGTFNSLTPSIESVNLLSLLGDGDTINDVDSNGDDITIIGSSNGSYGLISGNALKVKESTSLDTIHKVLVINDEVWLFGRDKLQVPSLNYPITLSTGVPI